MSFIHPEQGIVPIQKFIKILSVLGVAQIALVLLLFMKLDSFEGRMDMLTNSVGQVQGAALEVAPTSQNQPLAGTPGLDGQEVRRIVREELLAVRGTDSPAQNSEPVPAAPVFDEAEMQYQRDRVTRELDFLKEQDEVTTMELDRLMGDIAQLDPQSRTEMLKMLNRAMNRGEIKGNM